jgi:DNA-binding beta-propeller fold protein YncE
MIRSQLGRSLVLLACLVASPSIAAPPDLSVTGKIPGPDGGWDYASVDTATHTLFVGRTYGVMAIDLDTGKVTDSFVPGATVHGVIAIGDSGLAVSANGKSQLATLFDAKSGKVLASIPTGVDPDAVAFDPATGLVAIMEGDAHDALLIDPKAMKAVGSIALGWQPEFAAPDGLGHLFVNIVGTHELATVDIASRTVLNRVPLPGCEGPTGLAYDATDDLVISVCRNGVADVTQGTTGVSRASIAIGEGPDAAIYDSTHKCFYVPSGRAGTLAVIAVKSPTDIALVATVPTALGARTGAFDAKTGKLYLPTAQYQLPVAAGTRPQPLPGTFEIVVVGPK